MTLNRWSRDFSYRYRWGTAWRDVPEVFGSWQTIWTARPTPALC